uniref:Uncharacterized protein n=1 Tax=Vitis vinifera TaxID=29760 RepID=A5BQU1_VITVI|nr:hypothetical protein VITISV_021338 [Vitis vinifera]
MPLLSNSGETGVPLESDAPVFNGRYRTNPLEQFPRVNRPFYCADIQRLGCSGRTDPIKLTGCHPVSQRCHQSHLATFRFEQRQVHRITWKHRKVNVSVMEDENSNNSDNLKQLTNGKPPRHLSVMRHCISSARLLAATDFVKFEASLDGIQDLQVEAFINKSAAGDCYILVHIAMFISIQ